MKQIMVSSKADENPDNSSLYAIVLHKEDQIFAVIISKEGENYIAKFPEDKTRIDFNDLCDSDRLWISLGIAFVKAIDPKDALRAYKSINELIGEMPFAKIATKHFKNYENTESNVTFNLPSRFIEA